MRFLLTLNMPSAQGNAVHQIIIDHESETLFDLWKAMNDEIFIIGKQVYKRIHDDGTSQYLDRGQLIINSAHIGKAQEYIEYDRQDDGASVSKQRGPLRPRSNNY